jgi:hypothetical protein
MEPSIDSWVSRAEPAPPAAPASTSSSQHPLPPNTTAQEDLTHAGQRRINLIWERTQAVIAIIVVVDVLITATFMVVTNHAGEIPTIFSFAFGTVVGFYFSRTNHAAIGGVGVKPRGEYDGR